MPFEIVRNDISNMRVDAIVNITNLKPIIYSVTDTMFQQKDDRQLMFVLQKIFDIARGSAAVAPTCNLESECHKLKSIYPDQTVQVRTFYQLVKGSDLLFLLHIPMKVRLARFYGNTYSVTSM